MSLHSEKKPNPQGKGLVPVLADWESSRPIAVQPREPAELVFDWFVSALVLSSAFRFKPALGQDYYLYARAGRWQLSLVAPQEWGDKEVGDCLGKCRLARDMTWSMEAAEDLEQKPELRAALHEVIESFTRGLDSDAALDETLPGYRRELPYYQRLLATGLGTSLRRSVDNPELLDGSTRDLLLQAGEGLQGRLLAHRKN